MERFVPDTSVIIDGLVSELIQKYKDAEIIIHEAVLAELQHQASLGKSTGFLGLDELAKLRTMKIALRYSGKRPSAAEIKYASWGEIDAIIKDLAYDEDATLITADNVQKKVAEAKGIKVLYIKPKFKDKKIKLESFFDETTMSVHLKEEVLPIAKKGKPGAWNFVELREKLLTQDEIKDISSEIIEETKRRKDGYIEIEREGSTIVQLGLFRIVITRPPFSDGWEITAVRPVKKLGLNDYGLSEKLKVRIKEQAEGILIAGAPGQGKSTFASALAEYYASKKKIVKTIEAPRDLVLGPEVTQYAISHGDAQEIHDILLLSRPDYTIFDEMRNTRDFNLFSDLRLAGIGLAGVVHATNPIDAVQRFLGRTELGVIPHIIDTIIFITKGGVGKVLSLEMTVKVPSGMFEADLARPIVVVNDFETGKPEFEIYSYGEETVVVPVSDTKTVDPLKELAARKMEEELGDVKVRILSANKAELYVPESKIARIIGKQGSNIEMLEKKYGLSLDVKSLNELQEEKKGTIKYNIKESGKFVVFMLDTKFAGENVDVYVDDHLVFSSKVNNQAELKVNKKNKVGQEIVRSLDKGKNIEIRF